MAALLFLLLPALAFASIDVELTGQFGRDSNMKVYLSGKEADIISEQDRLNFHLDDAKLKQAVRAYFGEQPTDAYLRSPTPWGDLYKSYNWQEVIRTLVPRSARILKITSEPQIVLQQIFENNSTKTGLFNVGINQQVENTVSSSWSEYQQLDINHEIKYNFDIMFINRQGKTGFSYTSKYGKDYKKAKTEVVGATSSMNVMLKPGQAVEAKLEATRGTILVEIDYEASLSGSTAVNFENTYRGSRFWSLDVRAVMNAANLKNTLRSKEVIEIGFYSDAKVVVKDRQLGQKMMEVNF